MGRRDDEFMRRDDRRREEARRRDRERDRDRDKRDRRDDRDRPARDRDSSRDGNTRSSARSRDQDSKREHERGRSRDGRPRDDRPRDDRPRDDRPRDDRPRDDRSRDDRPRGSRSSRGSDMPPPPRGMRRDSMPPPPPPSKRTARDRSMTVEAPPVARDAKQVKIVCQACAVADAQLVCYNCQADGALYCKPCFTSLHEDPSMQDHNHTGPVLRCARGDCNGAYAAWFCSVCNDVCHSCTQKHCLNHRDQSAVLVRASTRNLRVAVHEDAESASGSSSGSSSSSEARRKKKKKKKKKKKRRRSSSSSSSGSSSSSSVAAIGDKLVPTWGRTAKREEEKVRQKTLPKSTAVDPVLGMDPNPKEGVKMPNGNIVGRPPLPRQYRCDYCKKTMEWTEERHRCTLCEDPPYDLCAACFVTCRHKHEDFLSIRRFELKVQKLPILRVRDRKQGSGRDRDAAAPADGNGGMCFICGTAGHFAKECPTKMGVPPKREEEKLIGEHDNRGGIDRVLRVLQMPMTDEHRIERGREGIAALKRLLVELTQLRERKRQKRAGFDVTVDEAEAERLKEAIEVACPAIEPVRRNVIRAPTPEIAEYTEERFDRDSGGSKPPPPPPQTPPSAAGGVSDAEALDALKASDVYDAAEEFASGAKVPKEEPERGGDDEFDRAHFDAVAELAAGLDKPLVADISSIVKKLKKRGADSKPLETMCALEARIQCDRLSNLQRLAAWFLLDAVMKRLGGVLVRIVASNLPALVVTFLPPVMKVNSKWRALGRDMLRSWRDLLGKETVDAMLKSVR